MREDFIKNPIRPIIQEEKKSSTNQGLSLGKDTIGSLRPKTEQKNIILFLIKEKTSEKITVAPENPSVSGCDSKEYEFILNPNTEIKKYEENENTGEIEVNSDNPLLGIASYLKTIATTGTRNKPRNTEIKII